MIMSLFGGGWCYYVLLTIGIGRKSCALWNNNFTTPCSESEKQSRAPLTVCSGSGMDFGIGEVGAA